MKKNTNDLIKKAEELFNQEKFDEVIALLTDKELETQKNAELYVWRGNAWYNKKDVHDKAITYDKAIKDYNKAIDIKQDYTLALYNKAQAYIAKKEHKEAIEYLDKVIYLDSKFAEAYISRGHIKRVFNEDYEGAIDDYTEVINNKLNDKNAYYYRGLSYYKKALKEDNNIKSVNKSKDDFEEYLRFLVDEKDYGSRYAKYYLKKLDEINDSALSKIIDLVSQIKEILRINDDCITHYTTLSTMKKLILTDTGKLWISEGNFMNDLSEGKEFFSFLYGEDKTKEEETIEIETFVPKPFIGSFITKDKHNDLNMWRFYGREEGIDAKGCSITLNRQGFIEDIKNSLLNEKNEEARIDDESDINFYRVVYISHIRFAKFEFSVPKSDQIRNLKRKMDELKKKVNKYEGSNKTRVVEYLNNIAFLFKRADYENENEVRLVMTGIEFEKKFEEKKEDKSINPPRVYIELEPIRKRVEQITLGPKVDKATEWASALYYSYKDEEKVPKITISHIPYK